MVFQFNWELRRGFLIDLCGTIKIAHFAIEIHNPMINYQANPQEIAFTEACSAEVFSTLQDLQVCIGRNTGIRRKCDKEIGRRLVAQI